ncbi:MAG: glycosyltransferase family 4 protein [Alphaproteobacteria bacterium]|uniref:Glycosyltransferase family 4 protein n=1 Tax=Candidatus Nitrobium versatile TaxID=2884831 RepID=A0A953J8I4_9BACT|nr:glycosyltransferase family 4 protein [Candidatus Nitrobium versatile]
MKRILYIEANRDGTVGGSYYSLLYLIQGLDRTKYEPHVLFCQEHPLIPEFRKATPHLYINDFGPSTSDREGLLGEALKFPYRFVRDVLLKQRALGELIRTIRPDLVHLNNGYSFVHEMIVSCRLHNVKVIAHDRGTRYPCSFRTRLLVPLLDAIVSVSDSYKENIVRQHLKVKRVSRIYNGFNSETIRERVSPLDRDRVRQEFGVGGNAPLLGIVGNIDRWKGQMVVVKAVQKIRRSYPDVACLIVGAVCRGAEGYREELEASIRENGLEESVIFTGFRDDVPGIVNALDVLLHASIEPEPFGRVLLEGMALSKPIVATAAGGVPEIIVQGETGLLVPMNDPDALANATLYFLSHPDAARKMGERGWRRLIEEFSGARVVREVERVYEEVFA